MDLNTFLAEVGLPTIAIEPKNWTGAAGDGAWASLKQYSAMAILLQTGAWAGGTAAVTLEQAQDISGTGGKALTFSKPTLWVNTKTAGAWTVSAISSNTFNLSAADSLYLIEVPARSLDLANNFHTVRVRVASPGANNDFYSAAYLFRQARYMQGGPSYLPDPLV